MRVWMVSSCSMVARSFSRLSPAFSVVSSSSPSSARTCLWSSVSSVIASFSVVRLFLAAGIFALLFVFARHVVPWVPSKEQTKARSGIEWGGEARWPSSRPTEDGPPVRATRQELPTAPVAVVGKHPLEDFRIGAGAEEGHLALRVVGAGAEADGGGGEQGAVGGEQGRARPPEGAPPIHRCHVGEAAYRGDRARRDRLGAQQGEGDAVGEAALLGDERAQPPGDLVEHHRG